MSKKLIYLSIILLLLTSFSLVVFFQREKLIKPTSLQFFDHELNSIVSSEKLMLNEINSDVLNLINKQNDVTESYLQFFYEPNSFNYVIGQTIVNLTFGTEEIISLYLNNLYFDNGLIGLRNAAEFYLNKDISQISLTEFVVLMSIAELSELEEKDVESKLRSYSKQLNKENIITDEQYKMVMSESSDIIEKMNQTTDSSIFYLSYVIDELVTTLNIKEQALIRKPYMVYTNLDKGVQEKMAASLKKQENYPDNKQTGALIESGMAVISHDTGKIAGLVGGRNDVLSGLNRASEITRQPGSAFKPLVVYAPAIEQGWKVTDLLRDEIVSYGHFKPLNADYKFRGTVRLDEALIHSYNAPAVWLLNEIGLQTGLNELKKYGLFTVNRREGLEVALGFTDIGTSPLALAQAFTVFAEKGDMSYVSSINSVLTEKGKVIHETKPDKQRILKENTADLMLDMLKKVVNEGTGQAAKIDGEWVAGKTGTTSYDGWFVGITDEYVGAVWVGNENLNKENQLEITGGSYPAIIFKDVFENLNK